MSSTAAHMSDDVLREIGRGILHGIDTSSALYRDSPPEAILSTVLRLLLRSEVEAGRLTVHSRERVVLPSTPAMEAELDLVLHQSDTDAQGVIEIQGWAWHRRSRIDHDQEIRRERLLRRSYAHLEVYSATEVMDDPWGTALEIVDLMGSAWSSFTAVELPAGLRALAQSCAETPGQGGGTTASTQEMHPAPEPIAMLGRLRALVESLPPAQPCSDPALQTLRRAFPRAYASWHVDEIELLNEAYHMWIDIDDIAQALQRTPSALWAQLKRMGLVAD